MGRRKAPAVQFVNEVDDPYLLVRAATETDAEVAAFAFAKTDRWTWVFPDEDLVSVRVGEGRHWRWTPAQPDGDYSCHLHPAKTGSPGAFFAWKATVEVRERELAA